MTTEWQRVCELDALVPDRGAAALIGGHQVALFRLSDSGEVHAVDHLDPFSQANVMARGLVGSRKGIQPRPAFIDTLMAMLAPPA